MYKIYYLTSEIDQNIPMYVGMTKLSLRERLKEHLDHKKGHSRKDCWKLERNKNITIHLIEDNISTFSECIERELYWIQYWKDKNPNLKNSVLYKLSEHPYTNSIENIKRNISEGVIAKKCKSIIVLDIKQNFVKEFKTILQASEELKIKDETISKNLRNLTKATKYIFLYKTEYDPNKDYSYKIYNAKERKKSLVKPLVSENCRLSVTKPCIVINIKTNKIYSFNTQEEASKFVGCSNPLISKYRNTDKLFKNIFKFL